MLTSPGAARFNLSILQQWWIQLLAGVAVAGAVALLAGEGFGATGDAPSAAPDTRAPGSAAVKLVKAATADYIATDTKVTFVDGDAAAKTEPDAPRRYRR